MADPAAVPGFCEDGSLVSRSLELKFSLTEPEAKSPSCDALLELDSTAPITAAVATGRAAPASRRKRARGDSDSGHLHGVICGSAAGAIAFVELSEGSPDGARKQFASMPAAISSVAMGPGGRSVWAAAEGSRAVRRFVLPGRSDPDAAAWSKVKVSSKSMGTVTAMATLASADASSDSDALVVGGDELAFTPHGASKPAVRMSGGHASSIVSIAASEDGELVVSSDADRVLCAWRGDSLRAAAAAAGDKSPSAAPAAEVTMQAPPRRVRITALPRASASSAASSAEGNQYVVTAASTSGVEIVVLSMTAAGAVAVAAKAFFPSESIASDAEVLDAAVHASAGLGHPVVAVAVGSTVAPVVVRSNLMGDAGAIAASWGGRGDSSASSSSSSANSAPKAGGTRSTVASAVPAGVGARSGVVDGTEVVAKRMRAASEHSDDEDDEADLGVSMADRLRALTGAMQSAPVRAAAPGAAASAHDDDEGDSSAAAVSSSRIEDATPSSMATVLSQALHASDAAQVELVLSSTDAEAVDATVACLEARSVVPLLRQVVSRFEAQPSRGASLARWLRAVMVHHAAALASTPGLVSKLSGVYHIIDARLAAYRKLLRLSGRLDLILGQLGSQASAAALSGVVDETGAAEIALA
ncbi:hypothetical protein FNF27_06639 [Cafeteria roenbergensis]|uniref:Small-subunit processome Utp12 domain-containing protein n=1 Tax=Cafeteria roenbergensis TaxID=33653 RepID=A0A5A8CJF7_CAFRO|nr:hypothetical protein FNF29_03696 [Cafeteria roenbergensis]KAA0165719.1 hypothetical protein FNF31_01696 [Cafeteria roenbergensis]KAA0170382.1 hypothetical protein FNF27_06639 [Cafeteria roenbergensis]KAA0171441.1 hypothetical protein FNF28_00653 [Cafeteria roenbergensis]|eukprot:KAA0152809.1 hypothetical protein FNF29_03696 [Cafeteria roenbergensis]